MRIVTTTHALTLCNTVAILTDRIHDMAIHMKNNHKDFSAKRYVLLSGVKTCCSSTLCRGLEAMLQKRKRLLMYLRRTKYDNYSMLITRLGLKDTHMRMV